MNCTDVRLAVGAQPNVTGPELDRHLRECAACAAYRADMVKLDENIRRALRLDTAALRIEAAHPQAQPVAHPWGSAPPRTWRAAGRRWALAASVLLAVIAGFVLWGALPRHSLAADVVAHVISEPWSRGTGTPVPRSALATVLKRADLRLDSVDGDILFAQTCFFRGRWVPHFVVRTGSGPVTVLILPNERVRSAERFAENGYSGILLPASGVAAHAGVNASRGSIAVLSRSAVDAEKPAREILEALRRQPG